MKVLLALLVGLSSSQGHLLFGDNYKLFQAMGLRLDKDLRSYVCQKEGAIAYGDPAYTAWVDVEADEVDLAKELTEDAQTAAVGKKVQWHQWAGIVQRGEA